MAFECGDNCLKEEDWCSIFDRITDIVTIHDPDFNIIHANKTAKSLFGLYGGDDAVKCYRLFHYSDSPLPKCDFCISYDSFKTKSYVAYHKGLDSHFEVQVLPRIIEGNQAGFIRIARDITDRILAEQKTGSLLEEKSLLLREMNHRVKNNFMVLYSLLNLQVRKLADVNHQTPFIEASNRLKAMSMIHDRLAFSSRITDIDAAEYFRNIVEVAIDSYEDITPKVTAEIDIPDIRMDIGTIITCGLIINETVSNSLKHAFSGIEDALVSVSMKKCDRGSITLVIADNGVGLADGWGAREGSGSLGTQIVDSLVAQLDGDIEIDATDGTRTRIRFFDKFGGSNPIHSREVANCPGVDAAHQILLAEDDRISRLLLKRLLEKQGYGTLIVNNGAEAVQAALASRFDCIVMDIEMPVMGGIEAVSRIRQKQPGLGYQPFIVAMTGHGFDGSHRDLLSGFDSYLNKPVDVNKLKEIIETGLARRQGNESSPGPHLPHRRTPQ